MKKKNLLKGLVALVLTATPVAVVAEPAEALSWVCHHERMGMQKEFDGQKGEVTAIINYRFCVRSDNAARVRVTNNFGIYNVYGSRLNCNWNGRPYDGFRFNFYYWDAEGRNFNPRTFKIPCNESSVDSRYQSFTRHESPWLYFHSYGVRQPRAKVNVTIEKNWAIDEHLTMSKKFHG